jgi:hypothetical protein
LQLGKDAKRKQTRKLENQALIDSVFFDRETAAASWAAIRNSNRSSSAPASPSRWWLEPGGGILKTKRAAHSRGPVDSVMKSIFRGNHHSHSCCRREESA